jgi:GTP-binding protein HflX
MLDDKIIRLRGDLDEVKRTRAVQRAGRRRSGTPVVALVGYTNSGKSTLFNRLTGADVFAKDMPFATLDPTIRKLQLPSLGEAALIDTVGFISDLPTHLIDSFQATLEESLQADLLVHVRDRSSAADLEQASDVMKVLERLEKESGMTLPPLIEAWNKIDAVLPAHAESLKTLAAAQTDVTAVAVSALTGDGVEALLQRIEKSLLHGQQEIELVLAPEAGRARAWLHQNGDVTGERTEDDGASRLVVRLSVERLGQFKAEFPGLLPAAG